MNDLKEIQRKVNALRNYLAAELFDTAKGSYEHGVYSGKISTCYDVELILEHYIQERERDAKAEEPTSDLR